MLGQKLRKVQLSYEKNISTLTTTLLDLKETFLTLIIKKLDL